MAAYLPQVWRILAVAEIQVFLASVYPGIAYCHSEPFDGLRINFAKNHLLT